MQSGKIILDVLKKGSQGRTPWWLMRQAGRYLPEYRAVRAKAGSFLDLCFHPEMASEVTLQPLRRFNMDAAIIFSDILVVPYALGQQVGFFEGEGPRLGTLAPDRLQFSPERIQNVYRAIELTRMNLAADKALIGFAGAPFTVSCYMIDGQGGGFPKTQKMMREDQDQFGKIINLVTDATIEHLSCQIKAGVDLVQIFDSWSGILSPDEFTRFAIDPVARIVAEIRKRHPGTPIIGFPRGAKNHYADFGRKTGVDAIGVGQESDLAAIASDICLQGNLDPEILLAGGEKLNHAIDRLLDVMRGKPYIFNLGHGIIKETPIAHVEWMARKLGTL